MAAEPATTGRWGGVELLERAIGYTLGNLLLVTPEAMSRPSPCARWDLRALLEHMVDSLEALREAADVRRVEPASNPDRCDDLVTTLRVAASHLLGEWSRPRTGTAVSVDGRPLTTNILTAAGALEIAVHGWDVAQACGCPRPLPAALAQDLLRIAPVLVTDADRAGRFAMPVAVPGHADPGGRLLAFLGRDPWPGDRSRRH